MASFGANVQRVLASALRSGMRVGVREAQKRLEARNPAAAGPPPDRDTVRVRRPPRETTGPLQLDYAPRRDGKPDPGEIVWAWVPYEEDDGRGKDRPVLVVARDGGDLLALMLTSKDHDRDAADEARHGRHWVDIGSGAWDRQGRPSEVRVDRVLRLTPADVRREGATLDRTRFDVVAAEVRRVRG